MEECHKLCIYKSIFPILIKYVSNKNVKTAMVNNVNPKYKYMFFLRFTIEKVIINIMNPNNTIMDDEYWL